MKLKWQQLKAPQGGKWTVDDGDRTSIRYAATLPGRWLLVASTNGRWEVYKGTVLKVTGRPRSAPLGSVALRSAKTYALQAQKLLALEGA